MFLEILEEKKLETSFNLPNIRVVISKRYQIHLSLEKMMIKMMMMMTLMTHISE